MKYILLTLIALNSTGHTMQTNFDTKAAKLPSKATLFQSFDNKNWVKVDSAVLFGVPKQSVFWHVAADKTSHYRVLIQPGEHVITAKTIVF